MNAPAARNVADLAERVAVLEADRATAARNNAVFVAQIALLKADREMLFAGVHVLSSRVAELEVEAAPADDGEPVTTIKGAAFITGVAKASPAATSATRFAAPRFPFTRAGADMATAFDEKMRPLKERLRREAAASPQRAAEILREYPDWGRYLLGLDEAEKASAGLTSFAEPAPIHQHTFEEVTRATPEAVLRAAAIADGTITPLPVDERARAILKAHARATDPDGSKPL